MIMPPSGGEAVAGEELRIPARGEQDDRRHVHLRLGVTSPLRPELSLAPGTSEVNLLELTAAYAALANQGNGVWPYGVECIGPPGETALYTRFGGGPGEAVLPWHVEAINRMLGATMTIGIGRSARLDDQPSAGKSGTSQGYRDAWFIGFTADYVVFRKG
jgi:penicillin-binding protein 1A